MNASKNITMLLQIPSNLKTPFKCKDGYLVQDEKELPYQLLIEKVNDKIQRRSADFDKEATAIYVQLEKAEQLNFSSAILDRFIYLKESNLFDFGVHYLYTTAAFYVLDSLTADDLDFYTQVFEKINKHYDLKNLEEETVLLKKLVPISRVQSLPKKLIHAIEERLKYLEENKKMAETRGYGFGYEPQYILCLKLLGKHNSIEIIKKDLDANFADGKMEGYYQDDFPIIKNGTYAEEQAAIEVFLTKEMENISGVELKNFPTIKAYLSKERPIQKNFFMALFQRIVWWRFEGAYNFPMYEVANLFARKKLPFTEEELLLILRAFIHPATHRLHYFKMSSFFKNVESHIKNNTLTDSMSAILTAITETPERTNFDDRDFTKLKTKVKEVLATYGSEEITTPPFFFAEQDNFGGFANQDLAKAKSKISDKWFNLLHHASSANSGKPSAKWITKAKPLVKAIGQKEFLQRLKSWIDFIQAMEMTKINEWYQCFIHQNNVPTVKGLMWSLSLLPNEELDQELEQFIIRCFKKIPGIGPASGAVGNACIYTIAQRNSLGGVAILNRAHAKIAQRNTKALIQKYIAATAAELNISISDLEDFSIQDFGLGNGVKEFLFNDYKARLTLASFGKTKLEWIKPDGKLQKSIPAFVRKDFADELKAIRNAAKLIPKTLTIQRDRLDRSYIQKRVFPFPHFEQFYLHHGLMSFLTKKLIWTFSNGKNSTTAIWLNDQWQDVEGKKVGDFDADTTVQLWHPLHSSTEEILQWRNLLQEHQIKQPLKQAYREVYILTDAEVNTKVYSNRMAAHILKQHQFNALAGIRGWKYQLMGSFDDGMDSQICSMQIPDYNLQAEFWINEVDAEDAFNDTGIWLYVATDQVRFTQGDTTIDMIDIPKIIFSEVMRDTDLFVGVGSVGNDPTWRDNGGLRQFNDYWQSYSFGDLTEVAKTRKTILEKLLPRLKIAKVASIQGKFLVVEGKIRTYKIHIGSTNILMEPNDQYLCIVPARGAGKKEEQLFIPFEGDRGFSILLSKAFMLAEDDKIEDATIVSQIGRK